MANFMNMMENPLFQLGLGMLEAGGPSATPVPFGQGMSRASMGAFDRLTRMDEIKTLKQLREAQLESIRIQQEEQRRRQQAMEAISQIMRSGAMDPQTRSQLAAQLATAGNLDAAARVGFPSRFEQRGQFGVMTNPLFGDIDAMGVPRSGASMFDYLAGAGDMAPAEPPPEEDAGPGLFSRLWDWATAKDTATTTVTNRERPSGPPVEPEPGAMRPPPSSTPIAASPAPRRDFKSLVGSFKDVFSLPDTNAGIVGLSLIEKSWVDKNVGQQGRKWVEANWDKLSAEQRAYALKLLNEKKK